MQSNTSAKSPELPTPKLPAPELPAPELTTDEFVELVDLAHDAVLVRDFESRIGFWNRGATELYGWSREQAVGRVSHELLQTRFPRPLAEIDEVLLELGAWEGELVHVTASGEQVVVASRWALRRGVAPNAAIVMEINRDITGPRRVELALRASEQAFADLFNNASDLIHIVAADGALRYANRAWCAALGYDDDEVRGLSVYQVVHPDERARYATLMQRALEGWAGPVDTLFLTRDGRTIQVEGGIHAHLENDIPVSVNGFFRDISDRARIEAERERLLQAEREAHQALARQNERLRELDALKDEFVSLVSHELRTPLTSMTGFLDLLLVDGPPLCDEHLRLLTVIDRSAKRLVRLVNDLLLIAEIDRDRLSLKTRQVDIAKLAAEAVEGAQPAAGLAGISLRLRKPPARPLIVAADEARIAQLLDNLIGNAIKFTPAGGHVAVSCRRRPGTVEVEVADTGIGIDPADQGLLFDRFFRTRQARERAIAGSGLGLTIARAIVERHSGSISVTSEPDAGSVFLVSLPTTAGEPSTRG